MADQLREAMEQKEESKNSFSMAGQYTSTVMQEQGPSGENREYVMYESPNGESMKVYGNWNEYAVSQDEEGNMMIADEDYPIVENAEGEFVLDEATFDAQDRGREIGEEAEGGPGASKMEDLMQMLGGARGQGGEAAPGMANGGKIYERGGLMPDKEYNRITVEAIPVSGQKGSLVTPRFYKDGRPVSPKEAAKTYRSISLQGEKEGRMGALDFNEFARNAILRSMEYKQGSKSGTVGQQQSQLMRDRRMAGVKGLIEGLSKYE